MDSHVNYLSKQQAEAKQTTTTLRRQRSRSNTNNSATSNPSAGEDMGEEPYEERARPVFDMGKTFRYSTHTAIIS